MAYYGIDSLHQPDHMNRFAYKKWRYVVKSHTNHIALDRASRTTCYPSSGPLRASSRCCFIILCFPHYRRALSVISRRYLVKILQLLCPSLLVVMVIYPLLRYYSFSSISGQGITPWVRYNFSGLLINGGMVVIEILPTRMQSWAVYLEQMFLKMRLYFKIESHTRHTLKEH